MRRTYLLAALLTTAALSSMPAAAQAREAWQDCNANGGTSLSGSYTIAELQRALETMPKFVEEYSDCSSVIQGQILKQERAAGNHRHPRGGGHTGGAGHNNGGNGGNGTPAGNGSGPRAHVAADSTSSSPVILIAVIAVVAIVGAGLAFWASRRRRGDSPPPSDEPPPSEA